MFCKGFFKRAVPFFLTFLIGVLIASIFIPVAGPNFQFRKNRWQKHREYHERMESEIQQLREENERLRQQLEEKSEIVPVVGIGRGRGSGDSENRVEVIKRVDVRIKKDVTVPVSER